MTAYSGARLSEDRIYRYELWRNWNLARPQLVVIGLNPSTADESQDDPTIRRCIGFAKREGLGGLTMLNLFAFRATSPGKMMNAPDPIGPLNDAALTTYRSASTRDDIVLAAWGAYGEYRERDRFAIDLYGPQLAALGLTKFGQPRHPLYLRADTPLIYPWGPA